MEMSLELAEKVFSIANWVLVGALICGVLATYAIVVSSNVKESYLKRDIAEANARTKESELALLKFRAPRRLTNDQINGIAGKVKSFSDAQYALGVSIDDPEQIHLATLIWVALRTAGWKEIDWYRDGFVRAGTAMIGKVAVPGDVVISSHPPDWPGAAEALVEALNAADIKAELAAPPVLIPFPGIKIMIGKKM